MTPKEAVRPSPTTVQCWQLGRCVLCLPTAPPFEHPKNTISPHPCWDATSGRPSDPPSFD